MEKTPTDIINSEIALLFGDCMERMEQIDDASVSFVLADLPFGRFTRCKWDRALPLDALWEHYRRVLKPNGVVALFGAQPFTSALVMSNPTWFRDELVWVKSRATNHLNANNRPMRKHEEIVIFSPASHANGARNRMTYNPQGLREIAPVTMINPTRASDGAIYGNFRHRASVRTATNYPNSILEFPSERGAHPTQKPVDLLRRLITTYTNRGEVVLDNVMGSGSTGVAALAEGRRFIGIEKDPYFFAGSVCRILSEDVSLAA